MWLEHGSPDSGWSTILRILKGLLTERNCEYMCPSSLEELAIKSLGSRGLHCNITSAVEARWATELNNGGFNGASLSTPPSGIKQILHRYGPVSRRSKYPNAVERREKQKEGGVS